MAPEFFDFSMVGMEDDRNTGPSGGQAAEEAGFGDVGVDDVVSTVFDFAVERDPCFDVVTWMEGTLEGFDAVGYDSPGFGFFPKAALVGFALAGDDFDFVPFWVQTCGDVQNMTGHAAHCETGDDL